MKWNRGEREKCVTDSQPFKDCTNKFAVRNLLLHMYHKDGEAVLDPPQNKKMRHGVYRAASLFIGMYSIEYLF